MSIIPTITRRLGLAFGPWVLLLSCLGAPTVSFATEKLPAAKAVSISHALLIGVQIYRDADVPPLYGVSADMDNARSIATAMGIPESNITELFNQQATKENIAHELQRLAADVGDSSRVLVYFSGHGTRWRAKGQQSCVEGLLTWDRHVLVNREFAELIRPVSQRADRLIVMFDACHSGGVAKLVRGTQRAHDELRPKFFPAEAIPDNQCGTASNVLTRGLLGAYSDGEPPLPENVIHIASARPDEVSFDEASKGGLATQAITRCLLGEAKDLDGSGAVTLAEVATCAQEFIGRRLQGYSDLLPHHVSLAGATHTIANLGGHANSTPNASGAIATLDDLFEQRSHQLSLSVKVERSKLKIGRDFLSLTVTPSVGGKLFLVLLGSDLKTYYILFPNRLDGDNDLTANVARTLPGTQWKIAAGGPAGKDHILALVVPADAAINRRLEELPSDPTGTYRILPAELENRRNLVKSWLTSDTDGRLVKFAAARAVVEETP